MKKCEDCGELFPGSNRRRFCASCVYEHQKKSRESYYNNNKETWQQYGRDYSKSYTKSKKRKKA